MTSYKSEDFYFEKTSKQEKQCDCVDKIFLYTTASDDLPSRYVAQGRHLLTTTFVLAAAHRRHSAHHFLATRHSSGASGSTPAALRCRGRDLVK